MGKFHCKEPFVISTRKMFCMGGEVLQGTVRAGMSVHIPFNNSFEMIARIDSVELAQTSHGNQVVLVVRLEDDLDRALWEGLNIRDEWLEFSDTPAE